jgi:hypothetical protein
LIDFVNRSYAGQRFILAFGRLAEFQPRLKQVLHLLEIQPELRTAPKETPQAQCCVWRNRTRNFSWHGSCHHRIIELNQIGTHFWAMNGKNLADLGAHAV